MPKRTAKQSGASRANGTKGKGATSAKGKNAIRFNAVKDAIFSSEIVVESAGESLGDFEKLRNELWDYLQPQTPIEQMLATDVIENRWRLQRVRRAEMLALKARVEGSWIQDELAQSEQLDSLKVDFLRRIKNS